MSKTIELIFDFVSPNGYLAWYPLQDIVKKHDAELIVTPAFLGGMHKLTGNEPPMVRDAHIKGKTEYAQLEMQRFIKKHRFDRFKLNPHFPFLSVMPLRLLLAAQELGQDKAFIEFMLPKIWEEGINPADPDVIVETLSGSSFDAGHLMQRIQDDDLKQKLIGNTEQAVARGVFGIPSFFVEGELYFGKERLGQIEEQLSCYD